MTNCILFKSFSMKKVSLVKSLENGNCLLNRDDVYGHNVCVYAWCFSPGSVTVESCLERVSSDAELCRTRYVCLGTSKPTDVSRCSQTGI